MKRSFSFFLAGWIFWMGSFLVLGGCSSAQKKSPEEVAKKKFLAQKEREALAYLKEKKYKEAAKVYKEIVQKYPKEVSAYWEIGDIFRRAYLEKLKKRQVEQEYFYKAMEYIRRYYREVSSSEGKAKALVRLAEIYQDTFSHFPFRVQENGILRSPYREAIQEAEKLLPEGKTPQERYYLGTLFTYKYAFRRAREYFQGLSLPGVKKMLALIERISKVPPESSEGQVLVFKKKLTRAEAAAFYYFEILSRYKLGGTFVGEDGYVGEGEIVDLAGHWAKKQIKRVLEKGILPMMDAIKNTFEPELPLTRRELAYIVTATLTIHNPDRDYSQEYRSVPAPFTDIRSFPKSKESYISYAVCAVKEGYMALRGKRFDSEGEVSGVEFMEVMHRFKKILKLK